MKDIIRRILEQEMEEGRPLKYSEDELLTAGCRYKNKRDFLKNEPKLHDAAGRYGLMPKIFKDCNYVKLGNFYNRMLYMYLWDKEDFVAVYFGLTCDEDRRFSEHTTELNKLFDVETAPNCKVGSSSVNKFIKEHGVYSIYQPLSDGYVNAEDAAFYEMCLIAKFREEVNSPDWDPEQGKRKLIVINRSKGGELGFCSTKGRPVLKDAQEILDKQIKTPEELSQISPESSDWWSGSPKRKQTLNKQLKRRFFEDAPYNDVEIFDVAFKFNTREDFERFDPDLTKAAKRKRMIDILFPKNFVYYNRRDNNYYTNLKELSFQDFDIFRQIFYTIRLDQGESIGISLVPKEEYERKKSEENKIVESVLKRISYK